MTTASLVRSGLRRAAALGPRRADFTAMTRNPRRDVIAGITVGVVALPLALAFGVTSGLGAGAGLITAIVAGFCAAVFGGSNLQVSGPTGAMTVVLVPIIAVYGPNGVLVVGMIAGVILLLMAFGGVGRFVQFIPLPVIEGFTLGIAVIIALQQVPAALGVTASGEGVVAIAIRAVVTWVTGPQAWPVVLSLGVAAIMFFGSRLKSPVPMSLIGIVLATLAAQLLHLPVARIGTLPRSLPLPQLPATDWQTVRVLVVPAFAVAALAALESLLSATVADAMSAGERHDPDRELFGQGIANLASPLFGGLPATAAIARTAVNVRSGARSRLAAITHALVLVAVVLALAPIVATIPLAALAGVLLATAARMVEVSSLRTLVHTTHRDAAAFAATALATVALDLVTAVILGVVLASFLALRAMAQSTSIGEIALAEPGTIGADGLAEEEYDPQIIAYRIEGSLFFGAAHEALLGLADVAGLRVVILRLSRLSTVDATGAMVLRDTIKALQRRNVTVLLSGVKEPHGKVLTTLGVTELIGGDEHLFGDTREAVRHARDHVAGAVEEPARGFSH